MITHYLDPEDVAAEILFGLIMALTFTLGATLVTEAGPERFREIVYGTVTCNLAWGLIDGALYVLSDLFELGRRGVRIDEVKAASSRAEAMERIREQFDERLAQVAAPEERGRLYAEIHRLVLQMEVPQRRPTSESLAGAAVIFVLVSGTSLPVLLPGLILGHTAIALEIANGLLISGLFATGYAMARAVSGRPIRFSAAMATIGLVLVAVAKALGG